MRSGAPGGIVADVSSDHHSEYLARAVAALTPEGHRRVDQLLDQLADAVADREWLVHFAKDRRTEADLGATGVATEQAVIMTAEERRALLAGFRAIRDQEQLDDVTDWANAVIALLQDS